MRDIQLQIELAPQQRTCLALRHNTLSPLYEDLRGTKVKARDPTGDASDTCYIKSLGTRYSMAVRTLLHGYSNLPLLIDAMPLLAYRTSEPESEVERATQKLDVW